MDQNKIKNFTSTYFKTDQLHHILKISEGVQLCLVCNKRIVCDKNMSDTLSNHLNSLLHKEEIKSLFELCNPDPLCNSPSDIYVDIVNKSVFDISVLLGDETCYIYNKEGYLFCALCQKNIKETMKHIQVVQYAISSHIKSKYHIEQIKEVCWVYPLNSENHFMLFHKTVIHCSICNSILQCKENTILQTVAYHLHSDQHEHLTSENNAIMYDQFLSQANSMYSLEENAGVTKAFEQRILKDQIYPESVKTEPIENEYNKHCSQPDRIDSVDEPHIKLNVDLSLKESPNDISDKHEMTFNMREREKTYSEIQVCHQINSLKQKTTLSLYEKKKLTILEEIARTISSSGNNVNEELMVISYGISYCILCWKQIKYSENHNALINRFTKHLSDYHPEGKNNLILDCVKSRTITNMNRLLKRISRKATRIIY